MTILTVYDLTKGTSPRDATRDATSATSTRRSYRSMYASNAGKQRRRSPPEQVKTLCSRPTRKTSTA